MFKFIRKFWYKCIVENKVVGFQYLTLFQILEKYRKFNEIVERPYVTQGDALIIENENEIVSFNNGKRYDLYYENAHIQIVDDKDKILRIDLKSPEEHWRVSPSKSNLGEANNKTMEAYLWYDIEVLGDRRCVNTIYTHGPWDEYMYKVLDKISEAVKEYTIQTQFSHIYNDLLFSKKHKNIENMEDLDAMLFR